MKVKYHIAVLLIFVLGFSSKSQNCNNIGFESTAPGSYTSATGVSGWTLSSSQSFTSCTTPTLWTPGSTQFSILSTPVFSVPFIGTLLSSPLGGNNVAHLNDFSLGTNSVKLSQNIQVTTINSSILYAFAGFFDGAHDCCDNPRFLIQVKDCSGNLIPSLTRDYIPASATCTFGNPTFTYSGSTSFTNWQVNYMDLSAYTGSCVTLELIIRNCFDGTHYGSVYFDADCFCALVPPSLTPINIPTPINYCASSYFGSASILAPLGYASYSWVGPTGSIPTATTRTLVLTSPTLNSTYTVNLVSYSGYTSSITYTLTSQPPTITALGASPSCPLASTGSATVLVTGGGDGYIYNWYNSQGALISNNQIVTGLSPGIYSVSATSCGSTTATYTVAVGTTSYNPLTYSITNFCSNQPVNLSASATGSNYQWYVNTTSVATNQGGNAQNYAVTNFTNNAVIQLSYMTSTGCKDTMQFYLQVKPPGTMTITSNPLVCQNANNGSAIISMTPSLYSPPSTISFSTWSLPGPISFSSSPTPSNITAFNLTNLNAGTIYSIVASDGLCNYSTTLTPNVFIFPNYSLVASSTSTCSGKTVTAGVIFQNPPPQAYSYSWSPTTFIQNNNGGTQTVAITQTTTPGMFTTLIYTVIISPSMTGCPTSSATIAITTSLLSTPIISSIPSLCNYASPYSLSALPGGGIFSGPTSISNNSIFPNLASPGTISYTYSLPGICINDAFGTFTILPQPLLTAANSSVCFGQTTTLSVSGANTYSWNNGSTSSSETVSPSVTTVYTVTGIFSNSPSCPSSKTVLVNVKPSPTVEIAGSQTLCAGSVAELNAFGANCCYLWEDGFTTNPITIAPIETTTYTVKGFDFSLCWDSATIVVTVTECMDTGLNERVYEKIIQIYPNPGSGIFYIETSSKTKVSITDVLGKIILEEVLSPGKRQIDLSGFNNGIYFLHHSENNRSGTIKLLKE